MKRLILTFIMIFCLVSIASAADVPYQIDFRARGTTSNDWEAAIYSWDSGNALLYPPTLGAGSPRETTLQTSWGNSTYYFIVDYNSATGAASFKIDNDSDFSSPLFNQSHYYKQNYGFTKVQFYAYANRWETNTTLQASYSNDTADIKITKFNASSGSPFDSLYTATGDAGVWKILSDGVFLGNIRVEGNFQFTDLLPANSLGTRERLKVGVQLSNSSPSPVPLPGAVLLLGAGMARLAAYARRRREE